MENDNDNLKSPELTDEELEQAAGGVYVDKAAKEKALADGHPILVSVLSCSCSTQLLTGGKTIQEAYTIYAEKKVIINNGPDEFRNCKCYACGKDQGNRNTFGFKVS